MRLVWLLTLLGLLGLSVYALDKTQTAANQSPDSSQVDDAPSFPFADAINAPCLGTDRLLGETPDLQPSQLDVVIPDVRGWSKNLFEAIASPDDVLGDEYKADFDGFVTVAYSDLDESCQIPATIRISGDLKDHLAWKNFPSPVSSLDIKLRDESIDGIVRFKLFLPGTRQGRWEILQTEVMRTQGLPSPRTFQIATRVNGTDVSYLFQEKLAKEMVEKHKLRDSLLLEADEELRWQYGAYFGPEELVFAKALNSNWVERGPSSTMIGWEGVTYLVRALGTTWHPLESLPDGTLIPNLMAPELLSPDAETTLTAGKKFDALMLATGSWHGLRPHNRKFYFDPMVGELIPVYYDGGANDYWGIGSDSPSEVLRTLAVEHGAAISDTEFDTLTAGLQVVASSTFRDRLSLLGANFTDQELNEWLDATIQNLSALVLDTRPGTSPQWSPDVHTVFQAESLFLAFGGAQNGIQLCSIATTCYPEPLDEKYEYKLLDGSLTIDDLPVKYAGLSHERYLEGADPGILPRTLDLVGFIGDAQVLASGPVELRQTADKIITITADDPETRVLVKGGSLIDWTVIGRWPASHLIPSAQRFDENLLTGCLTFLDNELSGMEVDMQGGGCEDSLNLMRATGSLTRVTIEDANQDALDLDFSDLDIDSIVISAAGNDCVDLSGGNYSITIAALDSCSDKALSVGERARVDINSAKVAAAELGFAVKDSSVVKIRGANVSDLDTCAAIYRKKQEFGGAALTLPRDACPESKIHVQPGSRLDYVDASTN